MKALTSNLLLAISNEPTDLQSPAYFASVRIDGKKYVHLEMDPGTAAALFEIGKAILSGLGAKALAKWFGLDNSLDVEALLRKLLLDITDVVHVALDEAEIRRAASEMQGLNVLMREYNNSPSTSLFRLQKCITDSATVLKILENLLPYSASAFIFGAMVRLAAAQELANVTGMAGERQNVREFAASTLPIIKSAFQRLIDINESRVSEVDIKVEERTAPLFVPLGSDSKIESIGDIRDPVRHYIIAIARYAVDGVQRPFYSQQGSRSNADDLRNSVLAQASASRDIDLQRVREEFTTRVGIPVANFIKILEEISQMT